MRFEKGHKAETRRHILDVASRRFRQDGISASGIAGIMGEAGLTNGAFYPHFKSKDELVCEALKEAINEQKRRVEDSLKAGEGLEGVVRTYLSHDHLQNPICPSAALLPEVARQPEATKEAYEAGIEQYLSVLVAALPEGDPAVAKRRAIAIFGLMAGTLQYARSVADPVVADQILESGVEAAMHLAVGRDSGVR